MGKIKDMFTGRRFRAGGYAVFAVAVVIVIAVLVNMVVGALPANTTQLDMTAQALYSLSDQTKQIVKALDQDVSLELLAYTGQDFQTLVTEIRIRNACVLLGLKTPTLKYIAHNTGFGSVQTFYRAFQNYKGMTPEEYREGYSPDSPQGSVFLDILCKKGVRVDDGLSIVIMNYMDAVSMDTQRLRECSMMVTVPDGRAIPFCSYHLTDSSGRRVYPPWCKEELRFD